MKKWFLILMALAVLMAGLMTTAAAEGVSTEEDDEIVEWVDLDEEDEELLEWVDLDLDEDMDFDQNDLDDEEIIEWVDLDADQLVFPEVCCEVLEDTFELSKPEEGAPISGGYYKGDLISAVDISGDFWLLANGNYVSADVVKIYNEDDIPGETEARTVINPRNPRDVKLVLAPIATDVEGIAEEYHSVIVYCWSDRRIRVFKYGIETLEVNLEDATWISPVFLAWTITEDFTEEGTGAVGVDGLMELVYQYSLPGSYLVIFP